MVCCDTTFLSLMLNPDAKAPENPSTKNPVERVQDRIEKLIGDLEEANERLIIPSPVLAEFLVLAGEDGPVYLDRLADQHVFVIKPFDEKAAIEYAALELGARKLGGKRGGSTKTWGGVKFDRQVVAIAKANGASRIYSDDADVRRFAATVDMEVVGVAELSLPQAKQIEMKDEKGFVPDGSDSSSET